MIVTSGGIIGKITKVVSDTELQVEIADEELFVRMVRTMFTRRRKPLANALKPFGETVGVESGKALAAAGIDPKRRPETLELAELATLIRHFSTPVS